MAKPDVPTTDGMARTLGWFKEAIENEMDAKIALHSGGASNAITGVAVDGTVQPVKNKIAILGLSAYLKKTDLSSGFSYKGSVNNFSDLPQSGQEEGDMYNILTTGGNDVNGDPVKAGDNVAWTGKGWDVLSGMVDLSNCVMKVVGKDLSSNDFTNAEKAKLAGLSNATPYTLPTASSTTKGGIKVGTGLSMNGDTLNCTMVASPSYVMPTASTTTKGGIKIGHGLQMQGETLNATATNYVLPTASATTKGGIKVGAGLSMNGDSLEATATNYTLPTASATEKGGIIPGLGLVMDGDVLNCTIQSSGIDNSFVGATAIKNGLRGAVPAPAAGEQVKFLCGNGKWEDVGRMVSGVVTGDSTAVNGALWMGFLGDGSAALKLRYGIYEYNFLPDSSSLLGSNLPTLNTNDIGQIYYLGTTPATVNGGLWYKIDSNGAKLGLHYGKNVIFDYFYHYDTLTYKGGMSGCISYLPLQYSLTDACGLTWTYRTSDSPIFMAVANTGYNAWLGNHSSNSWTRNGQGLIHTFTTPPTVFTVEFWFNWYSTTGALPQNHASSDGAICSFKFTSTANKEINAINNGICVVASGTNLIIRAGSTVSLLTTDEQKAITKKRVHIAITHAANDVIKCYVNGVYKGSTTTAILNLKELNLFGTVRGAANTDYYSIDHFRIWNKVVWPDPDNKGIDPPGADDYV